VSGRVVADTWTPAEFRIGTNDGVQKVHGYTLAGLGLHREGATPEGSQTRWALTHLGSGCAMLRPVGTLAMAMPLATDVARCTDWTLFDMPDGWRQTDPDLPGKVQAIVDAHPEMQFWDARIPTQATPDEARAFIAAREADDAR